MGNKYGSIHIKTKLALSVPDLMVDAFSDRDMKEMLANIAYWEKLSAAQNGQNRFVEEVLSVRKNLPFLPIGCDFYAVITEGWISIYNQAMTFQTIKEHAKKLARVLPELIVYASNFGDEVLVFGAYQERKLAVSGRICEDNNIFDLTNKPVSMKTLSRILGEHPCIPTKMPNDICDMEDVISRAMGISLNVFEDFVCSDPEHYEKAEERYGVRVYRKID